MTETAEATPHIGGRHFVPFEERKQVTFKRTIRPGMVFSPGEKVWACGKDDGAFAVARTQKGVPERFIATHFFEELGED